jgi:hypothetical protein
VTCVDAVSSAGKRLLERLGGEKEAASLMEPFMLSTVGRFLTSGIFPRRLDGLRILDVSDRRGDVW